MSTVRQALLDQFLAPVLTGDNESPRLPDAVVEAVYDRMSRMVSFDDVRFDRQMCAALTWCADRTTLPPRVLAPCYRTRQVIAHRSSSGRAARGKGTGERELVIALTDEQPEVLLNVGERWSDTALADLVALEDRSRNAWHALLRHAVTVTPGAAVGQRGPGIRWERAARALLDEIGHRPYTRLLRRWLPLVGTPRSRPLIDPDGHRLFDPWNVLVLEGLLWTATHARPDRGLIRGIGDVVCSALEVAFDGEPRRPDLARTAVLALCSVGTANAVDQVTALLNRVTHRRTRTLLGRCIRDPPP